MKLTRSRAVAMILVVLLAGCSTTVTSSPSATPVGSPSTTEAACAAAETPECLGELLAVAAEGDALGAVIAVAQDGETVLERAYGTTASGKPYEVDSSFVIASLGKMFTGVAVAQLVDEGLIAFADTAGMHVADLPPDVEAASIEQLLTHTSGLGDAIEDGIAFEPDEFYYTNAGFDLLARIVEAVSDQPFADHLEEHIFQPAGMAATRLPDDTPPGEPIGWGGEESTAGDLVRFAQALVDNQLLSGATTELVMSSKIATATGGYGYGFEIYGDADGGSAGHYGSFEDFLGLVNISTELGTTVVVLCDRGCGAMAPALFEFLDSIGMPY